MANLRIAELDFDQIKSNLKTYLESQSEFTDYDFEGSGLSVLLDILAYNTHYNAYLANMLANEMFLDSAVKRSSAVSLAKHLGYTPRSVTGSVAVLDIVVTGPTGTPTTLTLERYTPFSSVINGATYTFLNTEPITITPTGGVYRFDDVRVKEGTLLEYSYSVITPGPDEKYEIPNAAVDTSTLLVTVQTSTSDTTTFTYTEATDITALSGNSKVYFLEENPQGNYQIYFGDGILGQKLAAGNIVRIQYLVSLGTGSNVSGNLAQSFTADAQIGGSSNIAITVVSNSTGGRDRESISSIKFNAVRANQSGYRAVTKNDYATLIKSKYSQVESISVWGGEENTPPVYGKVYISLKPFDGFTVDALTKDEIQNTILKERQVLTTQPVFVDPDYIYVNIIANVNYNQSATTLTASNISNLVRGAISTYFSSNLQQFEKPFYHSELIKDISAVNSSIASVLAEIKVQKRLTPVLNVDNAYQAENLIQFNNRLHPGEFESTRFFITVNGATVTVRLKDVPNQLGAAAYTGTGDIRMYNVSNDLDLGSVGTIDYANGTVGITGITPIGYPTGQFDIRLTCSAQEDSYNITASRNQIIVLDDSTESALSSRMPGVTVNVSTI